MKYMLGNEKLEESVSDMKEQLAKKDKLISELESESKIRSL